LKDFNRSAQSAGLFQAWHDFINENVQSGIASYPAFYDPLSPPSASPPAFAAPQWTGLPRTIKRLLPGSIAQAAGAVDSAIPMGNPDPMEGANFTSRFRDAGGAPFNGPAYRAQDEYLEWATRRDPDGTITEILFTCEGPEYWDHIATDQALLLNMYKELAGDNTIQLADLLFPKKVTWANPNDGIQTFQAGDYNPYNQWNIKAAIHLTQPANTLGAEIMLAKDASRLYGNPIPVTTDPDLVCCAAYGGINRMSDPTIGLAVNTQVQIGNRVSLRNPIGLYMVGILPNDATKLALPDDTPFTHVKDCFQVLRPDPAQVTDMIVRARFRVPAGLTHNGVQLRVGDLKINGEKIVTGGQVADVVTMTLFAQAIPGAVAQGRRPCKFRPCHDPNNPEFIVPIAFNMQCPSAGISPLLANIGLARAAHAPPPAPAALFAVAGAVQPRPKTRHALSRVRGGGE
jgi:hypothetical protein